MAWLIDETCDDQLTLALECNLLDELRCQQPQDVNNTIHSVCQKDGTLKGGLLGTTSYGWLLLKVL